MDGWYTGSPIVLTLTVDPFDGTTNATVTVAAPDGTTSSPAATTADGGHTWTAVLPGAAVTMPGEWDAIWTVTGTGSGTHPLAVRVAPMPTEPIGSGRVYATTADLAHFLQAAPPIGARRLLYLASRLVEDCTRTAVYDVDAVTGMPTDAAVLAAFKEAVCAQAGDPNFQADPEGTSAQWVDVSIGSVRLARPMTQVGALPRSPADRLAPMADSILREAGLRRGPVGNYTPGSVAPFGP